MCSVCSFFLQLSLVDFSCTGYPACISAAASLSLSLEAYSHTDCWPAILQNYSGIIQQVSTISLLCCAVLLCAVLCCTVLCCSVLCAFCCACHEAGQAHRCPPSSVPDANSTCC